MTGQKLQNTLLSDNLFVLFLSGGGGGDADIFSICSFMMNFMQCFLSSNSCPFCLLFLLFLLVAEP